MFDQIEMKYIASRGWRVSDEGLIVLTAAQAGNEPYMSRSIRNPEQRTLIVPSLHGGALLFEGKHFIIEQ